MFFTKVVSVLALAAAASAAVFSFPDECNTTCANFKSVDAAEVLEDNCELLKGKADELRSCYICARQAGLSIDLEVEQSALEELAGLCNGVFDAPDIIADAEQEAGHAALSGATAVEAEEPVAVLNQVL